MSDVDIEAITGDITRVRVDAIVNAANRLLLGGGGVDGAIHAAAGPALLEACRELRRTTYPQGLPVGEAAATAAGALPATWVIHTVGPNRNVGETERELLAACFTSSLRLAAELGARSVAFPAIGAGAFGWQMVTVAELATEAVRSAEAAGVERVTFVLTDDRATQLFRLALTPARSRGRLVR